MVVDTIADVAELNAQIDGTVDVIAAYFGDGYRGSVPASFGLNGKDAAAQFLALARTLPYSMMDVACELAANHAAVFLNLLFWEQHSFSAEGIADADRDVVLADLKHIWSTSEHGAIPLGVVR